MVFTRRYIEGALHKRGGLSLREAKAMASGGYKAFLKAAGREDEAPAWEAYLGIKPKVALKAGSTSQPRDRVTDLLTRAELVTAGG